MRITRETLDAAIERLRSDGGGKPKPQNFRLILPCPGTAQWDCAAETFRALGMSLRVENGEILLDWIERSK